uniref:Acid-sensing ion channel 1-like n=1 Tax=Macrostomum lignano TaxID=282301 RepID=A0A1I8HD95_9PLAT
MATAQPPSEDGASDVSLAAIFSDCLRRSTVRGIPRIFSSRSPLLKTLWTASVLVLFVLFLWNLTGTVSIYMRGDTMFSNMKWEPLPPFPSFTICNFKPISAVMLHYTNLTPDAYRHKIIDLVENSSLEEEDRLNILFKLLEPQVYHDHLNMSEVLKLTEADSLIMRESCHVHYVNNSINQVKRCSDDPNFASVEFRYIPGYSHCQTVRLKQGSQVKKVVLHVLLRSPAD